MERRHFLKIAAGFAVGAAAVAATAARAAPLTPQPLGNAGQLPSGHEDAHPAVTTGAEVDRLQPEEVRWGRRRFWRRRRFWGWHRRRHWGWRRRWHRRRFWRRRYW